MAGSSKKKAVARTPAAGAARVIRETGDRRTTAHTFLRFREFSFQMYAGHTSSIACEHQPNRWLLHYFGVRTPGRKGSFFGNRSLPCHESFQTVLVQRNVAFGRAGFSE